jgi:hypothetical protein
MMRAMHRLGLALVVVAAACGGGGGGNNNDAGGDDGGGGDGSATTLVTLTIHDRNGAALAGKRVHFQNPDSTLIASVDTDASGVASAMMPNGGFVTAINPFYEPDLSPIELRTFAGAKGGDELVLDDTTQSVNTNIVGNNSPSDIGFVRLVTGCGDVAATGTTGGKPSGMLIVPGGCLPTTDIFELVNDVEGSLLYWGYLPDVTLDGMTLDASAIDVTNTEVQTKTVNYTVSDAELTSYYYENQQVTASGRMSFANASNMPDYPMTLPVVPGALDTMFFQGDTSLTRRMLYEWQPGFATTYAADVSAKLLRKGTAKPTFDRANHRLIWTEASTGVAPEWGYATAHIDRGEYGISWTVVGAAGGAALQLPVLPNEGTDYNPMSDESVSVTAFVAGASTGGYDAVRERLQGYPDLQTPMLLLAPGVTTGTLALQDYYYVP